jgi:two-component system, OmpR family, KDP operon response regulator KdpE
MGARPGGFARTVPAVQAEASLPASSAENDVDDIQGPTVLIIDEDPGIRRLIRRTLGASGYRVQESRTGPGALQPLTERRFDLAILDIDSLGSDGIEAIKVARLVTGVPILALSARHDEDLAVSVLDCGADDFVQKPFRIKEFLARVTNALRRRTVERGKSAIVVSDDLEIDLLRRRVSRHGRAVSLPLKSYEVLRVLAENAGGALPHDDILRAVWGVKGVGHLSYLRNTIRRLRLKLEADPGRPQHILTELHLGYRLEVQVHSANSRVVGTDAGAPMH